MHEQLSGITHSFTAGQPRSVTFTYQRDADERRMGDTVSTAAFLLHPPAAATTAYTPNALDQYATIGGQAPTYNSNANLTGDPAAPLANATYKWDFKNRLTRANNAQHAALYQYDALDRRSQKTVDGVTTVYVWDGPRIIAAYTSQGAEVQHWVYGAVALTNSTGQLTAKFAYSPWGEGSLANATPFGFAGMFLDAETGLYDDNARYYSPAQGRFVSPDPIGVKGGVNIYAYTGNEPVNGTDLSGLCATCDDTGYKLALRWTPTGSGLYQGPSTYAGNLSVEFPNGVDSGGPSGGDGGGNTVSLTPQQWNYIGSEIVLLGCLSGNPFACAAIGSVGSAIASFPESDNAVLNALINLRSHPGAREPSVGMLHQGYGPEKPGYFPGSVTISGAKIDTCREVE